MSKKHYQELAYQISLMLNPDCRLNAAVAVANACAQFNPRFDYDKFYVACGVSK